MAVLVQYDIANAGLELYDQLAGQMAAGLRASPGFVFHVAQAIENGWRVTEVWDSREQLDSWFDGTVQPNLPPSLELSRQVIETHSVIQP
jgi:quinol monooxygenase YgiN